MAGGGSSDGKSPHIDLVPIIDAMTCVIFFLLLSSTFVEFTKITMPSSMTSEFKTTSDSDKKPLAPKLFGLVQNNEISLVLSWLGEQPGHLKKKILRDPQNKRSEELQQASTELVKEFKIKFPNENSLQIGLSSQASYQELISAIDGARKEFNDIVMTSWSDEDFFNNFLKE